MYNKATLLACAPSLAGWREDNNAIYATLSTALKTSSSALWFNDLPGVSFETVEANVSADITAAQYLANIYNSEFNNIVNQFVNKSKQNYESKELLSRQSIVSGVASMNDRVTQNERFVGYWLRPHTSNYMKSQIISLGFQAVSAQAELKVFLYETSQLEAIKVFDLAITKVLSFEWTDVADAILSYESTTSGTGQNYLLGYYEANLTNAEDWQLQPQALYMNFDCGCSNSPKKIYGKYLGIQPVEFDKGKLNWNAGTSTFDIPIVDNVANYVTNQTYGLLAKINVTCDITSVLCTNIGIFARAFQHAVAVKILYDAYGSNRINSISDSKREQAKQFAMKYDGVLNGYTTPEGSRINGLIDTLTVDFSALDSYCLPCKQGITTGHLVR